MHLEFLLNTPHPTITLISFLRFALPCATLLFAVIVLIIIPQQQLKHNNRKKHAAITVGAFVTTLNGIRGTILEISENTIILQHVDGRKIEITKQAITSVIYEKS